MSIELEQLEAFVASADHGSFSAAARYLRKAQSAVSVLVSSLEDDLGVKLFSRASRNPVLTEAGARLLPEARLLLARREHLISVARNFGDHVESRLVVAIDELYPEPAIATLFAVFALEGKADLGVMWRAEQMPDELGFHTIGWVPLVLVCGREHPLAHTAVSWEDLRSFRQIMARKHSDTAESRRLRVGAEVWWVESHWVILQILTRGIGWAFIPEHILQDSPLAPELVIPKLQFDEGAHPVALELIWNKRRRQGPAAQWLQERFAKSRF